MSDSDISLIPIRSGDLAVGKPLPYAVYDWHGKLLLAAGRTVEDRDQLEGLINAGFMHDTSWDHLELAPHMQQRRSPTRRVAAPAHAVVDPEPPENSKEVVVNMDDVRWRIGESLYLQQIDNPAIRLTVRLIGFVKNRTVLVTAPVVDGKVVLVRDGMTYVARAFSGKKAYAFVVAAVKSVHSPHPYLHLSFPKEVRCTVVRRGVRAQVNLIAAVSLISPDRMGAATLVDLSLGGASGNLKQALGEPGQEGRIKFKVQAAGQDEYLDLQMVLRSVAPNETGDGFRHGFEFIDVAMHARLILSAFVHQILAEGE